MSNPTKNLYISVGAQNCIHQIIPPFIKSLGNTVIIAFDYYFNFLNMESVIVNQGFVPIGESYQDDWGNEIYFIKNQFQLDSLNKSIITNLFHVLSLNQMKIILGDYTSVFSIDVPVIIDLYNKICSYELSFLIKGCGEETSAYYYLFNVDPFDTQLFKSDMKNMVKRFRESFGKVFPQSNEEIIKLNQLYESEFAYGKKMHTFTDISIEI